MKHVLRLLFTARLSQFASFFIPFSFGCFLLGGFFGPVETAARTIARLTHHLRAVFLHSGPCEERAPGCQLVRTAPCQATTAEASAVVHGAPQSRMYK